MSKKIEQDQEFEAVLAEEYRRAAGVKDSFADGLMKRNRASSPQLKKEVGEDTRQLAKKLIGAK